MTAALLDRPHLGVGRVFGGTLTLFVRHFSSFAPPAVLPVLLMNLIVALQSGDFAPVADQQAGSGSYDSGRSTASHITQGFGHSLAAALLVLAARDALADRRSRMMDYLNSIGARVVHVLLCPTIVMLGTVLAGLFGLLPGLWLSAVWWVVVPVIVLEEAGLSSLGRSAALTREYRWPIVGLFLLLLVVAGIPVVLFAVYVSYPETTSWQIAWYVVMSGLSGCAGGLFSVSAVLTYWRLREIKEGRGPESLTAVFA